MATINTISDLLQALDDHPQWLEAVRERLLTKDIREAPRRLDDVDQRLNALITKIDAFIANTNQQLKGHEERLQSLEELLKGQEERLQSLEELLKGQEERLQSLEELLKGQEERLQSLEELLKGQEERLQSLEELLKGQEERLQSLEELLKGQEERLQSLEELLKGQEERLQSLEELLKGQEERLNGHANQLEALNRYIENAAQRFERQERDSSFLKGELFERRVHRMSRSLAREMGLAGTRTVAEEELYEMVDSRDTSDIAPGRLKSFKTADLVLKGVDQKGGPCYIAAEVSYTVDERDTVRAVSAAQLLTRFTGLPARAAVVGVRKDDCIQGQIEAGEVFYWAIDEDDALPR